MEGMKNIAELDSDSEISDIKKLIKVWTPHMLTPYEKITIVKSLLTSKIVDIMLSLPSTIQNSFKILKQFIRHLYIFKPPESTLKILKKTHSRVGRT